MEGPGNSLDINYYYWVEKDVNIIAERTAHTNVGLFNIFKRHDKPWMNERVRRVNLQFYQALMGRDVIHTGVTDTAFFREKLLHNSWLTPEFLRQEGAAISDS
jgi:hypothetical protein